MHELRVPNPSFCVFKRVFIVNICMPCTVQGSNHGGDHGTMSALEDQGQVQRDEGSGPGQHDGDLPCMKATVTSVYMGGWRREEQPPAEQRQETRLTPLLTGFP